MLLFGCLLAFGAAVAPRLILILAWLFGRRWDAVWDGNFILPLLGIIFLPYTTIMYLLVWSPTGLSGFDWVWLALGVMLDIMKWGQIARNREGIPGQESSAQPATQPAAAAPAVAAQPAAKAAPAQSELDKLAELRDEGVLTEEEYQAKKAQLEDQ
ncbi:MAG: SHOCT domain-containing protein [Chloroflexota bacterium]|nr:MAG: SHOCT domain-containing protein [Chloroflexota bacterium]